MKLYLHIRLKEKKEKNNSIISDELVYSIDVKKGSNIKLVGLNSESIITDVTDKDISVNIYKKGNFIIKLNETINITYTEENQVAGDYIEEEMSYELYLSNNPVKEKEEKKFNFKIENNVLIKANVEELKIIIPEGVTEIGAYAFSYSKIEEIILPTTLKKISQHAFSNSKNIKHVILPEGLEIIESFAFAFTNIENIIFPKSLIHIAPYAFYQTPFFLKYEKDEFVIIANKILYIYNGYDEEIIIPDGVRVISKHAFIQMNTEYESENPKYYIKKITLPDSVEYICEEAFAYLNALEYVNINKNIIIDKHAFLHSKLQKKYEKF